jgi:hypothetical protein
MPATTDPFVILNEAIRDLMATHLPAFAAEGRKLYAGLALILFCWFFIKSALSRGGVEWDRLASLLLFLSFGYSMTEFYATPIPGVGYSFAGLITAQASWMADAIGRRIVLAMNPAAASATRIATTPALASPRRNWASARSIGPASTTR